MRELLNLAATVIEASGATERRRGAARAMLVMIATTAVALCGVGTVICLLAALWVYEMPLLGDAGAPLVVAAVLAAATLVAAFILRAKTTPPPPDPPGIGHLLMNGGLQALMRSNKLLVLLGAMIIGMAAAEGSDRQR
jgi:hypothetical protein